MATSTDPALPSKGDAVRVVIDYLRLLLAGNASGKWDDAAVLERMREVLEQGVVCDGSPEPFPRPFADLQSETGLLWLINRQVFHPWGYQLAIVKDSEGVALGWELVGDGAEPWNFEDGTETPYLAAARRVLTGEATPPPPVTDPDLFHLYELTMQYDTTYWVPFVEGENCDITGPGHQDKEAFAAAVNAYDAHCNGGETYPVDELWTADDIGHAWIVLADDGERFITEGVTAETPGAIPVTTLWGAR